MANFRNQSLRQAQTGDPPEGWGVQADRRGQILILEILHQCIPVVKIIAFLDLAQIFSFMDGH